MRRAALCWGTKPSARRRNEHDAQAMDRARRPDSVEVFVTVDHVRGRAGVGLRRRLALVAAIAVVLTLCLALSSSGGEPVNVRSARAVARPVGRPPVLDADGDLDGSVRTLRLHFDPDDAR